MNLENLKTSTVLAAMVEGLKKSKRDPTMGRVRDEIRFQNYCAQDYLPKHLEAIKYEENNAWGGNLCLQNLQCAIDNARRGNVSRLIEFLTEKVDDSFDNRWNLENHNWEEQIPIVESAIVEMIAAGL